MVFSSLAFIFLFLPFSLLAYYITPKNINLRNITLISLSILFYAYGDIRFILPIVLIALFNYLAAVKLSKARFFFIIAVTVNLSLIIIFKYLPGSFAAGYLPLGISFFTFQNISYLCDVHSGRCHPEKVFKNYLLYILFFPQLVAGPIVRYSDISSSISARKTGLNNIFNGLYRFSCGLFKKAVLAETLSVFSDAVFSSDLSRLPFLYAWLGALGYAFRIYNDFSGYTDMAIGLGIMFGFKYPENFDYPYISQSISEFFRRWHITLSGFFRDYVYIPLGGSKKGRLRTVFNTLTVFILTGIWHGNAANYILWGLTNGVIVCLEKEAKHWRKRHNHPPATFIKLLKHLYTLLLILIGWVIFASDSLPQAIQFISAMFKPASLLKYGTFQYRFVNIKYLLVFVFSFFSSFPIKPYITKGLSEKHKLLMRASLTVILYFLSVLSLINGTYKPFIYFKF